MPILGIFSPKSMKKYASLQSKKFESMENIGTKIIFLWGIICGMCELLVVVGSCVRGLSGEKQIGKFLCIL